MTDGIMESELVLVTGACGFSGRWLVRRLLDEGYRVRAADVATPTASAQSDPVTALDERAQFVICDVTNKEHVEDAVKGCVTVFHMAALVPYNLGRAYFRNRLLEVNVDGTRTLVAASSAAGVRQLLLCSSTGVTFAGDHVENGDETLNAAGPWNDPYSESKALAEASVLAVSDPMAMATIAIRPNGIMGPGEMHHTPKLLLTARLGLAPFMALSQNILTDFCHRDNLVHAFMLAHARLRDPATRSQVSGQAYFVTDGFACHTVEFFSPLLQELGFRPPFPCAILPAGTNGHKHDARVSRAELDDAIKAAADAERLVPGQGSGGSVSSGSSGSGRASGTGGDAAALEDSRPQQPAATAPLLGRSRAASSSAAGAPSQGQATQPTTIPAIDPQQQHQQVQHDEIVLTAPAFYPLPGLAMYPAAALLQAISMMLQPFLGYRPEPFLTVADVRKVVAHNYYSSAKAARELGYSPVTSTAKGIREMAAYYKRLGYDGHVDEAGWLPWILAPPGVAFCGILGYDAFDILTSIVRQAGSTAAGAEALSGLTKVLLPAFSAVHQVNEADVDATAAIGWPVQVIFWAAMLCHALQGVWVFRHAWPRYMAAGAWGMQSFLLGFASTRLFVARARMPITRVPARCVGLFVACMPIVIAVQALNAYVARSW